MADVTTENIPKPEIPTSGPRVHSYDFTSTKKFSGESMGVLDSVYTSFGRLVETHLAGLLRLNCAVRLLDIQEKRYSDFSSMFTSGRVMAVTDVTIDGKAQAPAMMYMSNNVVLLMMDRLMGGPGEVDDAKPDAFTEIELAVLERLVSYLIPLMNDAWLSFYPVEFAFNTLKHNPKLVTGVSQQDLAVIVMLKVTVNEASGQISICLPSSALESLFNKLAASDTGFSKHNNAETRQAIFDNVLESNVELQVRLEETEVMLKDLFSMQEGDIVNLNIPVGSQALVCVDEVPFFRGELGVHRQRTAIKITDTVKK